jgi:hypothetical protein
LLLPRLLEDEVLGRHDLAIVYCYHVDETELAGCAGYDPAVLEARNAIPAKIVTAHV